MKLLLLLILVADLSANPTSSVAGLSANPTSSVNRDFISLIASVSQDYSEEDITDMLASQQVYLDALSRNEDEFLSGVELLIEEEAEMEDTKADIEESEEIGGEEEDEPDISNLPEALDNRDRGIMHSPIWQGLCGSCGWISGTQTLEARIALVSENYIPYSIQNFMNCAGKPCVGVQPYAVTTQLKKGGFAVPESEIPYTRTKCVKAGPKKSVCFANCGIKNQDKFTNALNDQFVIIAGSRLAQSEAQLIKALQDGPVTTCFHRSKKLWREKAEKCGHGCSHANSIVGYDSKSFILQESYGKNWSFRKQGKKDGSWNTTKESICADAIIKKAVYPKILYDYDRANAFYTPLAGGVNKNELQFVDKVKHQLTANHTQNWGTAKNKCAFLGSACKGVVQVSPGEVELVADFGAGSSGDLPAFKKFQMVIYLRHEGSGKYIGITKNRKGLELVTVNKANAAPFFASYARFISFQYPEFHLVYNKLEKIEGGIGNVDVLKSWNLAGCNIYNDYSGLSFDQVANENDKIILTSNKYNSTASSQKFNIGLSGEWSLTSSDTGLPLVKRKGGYKVFSEDPKATILRFRWNARQIINMFGKPYNSSMMLDEQDFKFENKEFSMRPRDCAIRTWDPITVEENMYYLAVEKGELVMSSDTDTRWTFEYADL